MENQSLNSQLTQEESSLLNLVTNNLARIAGLKCLSIPKETYRIWYEQIVTDMKSGEIKDVKKGFDNLLKQKSFGGLDYSVFFDGAKNNNDAEETENAWKQVWQSAINNGFLPISARSAKTLNSLGGLEWVKNSDPDNVNWTRKEFLAVYAVTPEPADNDFRCFGLNAEILPPKEKQLRLA